MTSGYLSLELSSSDFLTEQKWQGEIHRQYVFPLLQGKCGRRFAMLGSSCMANNVDWPTLLSPIDKIADTRMLTEVSSDDSSRPAHPFDLSGSDVERVDRT